MNQCLICFRQKPVQARLLKAANVRLLAFISDAFQEDSTPTEPAGPVWTAEALERLERIPAFVRPMAKNGD